MKALVIVTSTIIVTSIILFMGGCAAPQIPYKEIQLLKFVKIQSYSVDLDQIQKPSKPVAKYGKYDSEGRVIFLAANETIDSAGVVVFDLTEYQKIGQLAVLASTYKTVIKQQELLINNHIDTANALKELVELERMKTIEYSTMWTDASNMHLREVYDHRMDNIMNKAFQSILVGGILGLAI